MYYGNSGDVRSDLSGGIPSTHNNYQGESQISGILIERGRRYAYNIINGKLQPSYPTEVPWASGGEPDIIYEIANKLTQCFVLNTKSVGREPVDKSKREDLCEHPVEMLDQLASGEMEFVEIENPFGPKVYHTHSRRTPIADMDPIVNHWIDPDRLDDIRDERES